MQPSRDSSGRMPMAMDSRSHDLCYNNMLSKVKSALSMSIEKSSLLTAKCSLMFWTEATSNMCWFQAADRNWAIHSCDVDNSMEVTTVMHPSPPVIIIPTIAFVEARNPSAATSSDASEPISRMTLPPSTTFSSASITPANSFMSPFTTSASSASISVQRTHSLSKGAIARIVVGSIAAFVIILSLIFLLWRRKHSQAYGSALHDQLPEFIPGTYYDRKRELNATGKGPSVTQEPTELPVASSMPDSVKAVEMAGEEFRHDIKHVS